MNDCVFCKILRGDIPCRRIYEDENVLAFLDIAGDVDGHVLVIPKGHVATIAESDEDTFIRFSRGVKRVADHLVKHCGYDGVNLLHASGESAGQSVPHLHMHLIPRKAGDGLDAWPKFPGAKEDPDTVLARVRVQ